ncbi:hypothetical protein PENSPDRAFT_652555 [Peniophora sp. CONT]|nr:hypothetical protein PENSPDRAFT_652555 [Peniophora sp. CONT]
MPWDAFDAPLSSSRVLCTTVMSLAQEQYTILAPASTSSNRISPQSILPPSLSNKRPSTLKQPSSSTNAQRSPQPIGMTSNIAQTAVDRLISAQLKEQGFDGAEPAALQRLGDEVIAYVEDLYQRAQDYANLANRASPMMNDLRLAFVDVGLEAAELRPIIRKRKRRSSKSKPKFELVPPPAEPPAPEMLGSDDEDSSSIPATIQELPPTYPPLPPRHTYVQTPPSPPKKQALPSLEKKLKNAGLVQESLRNLLVQTEDVVDPADTDLLGAIVNCESTAHPRKKWKVSKSKVDV